VVFTHIHWDHFVNFDLFEKAKFIISEQEIKSLKKHSKRRDRATPHQILNIINSIQEIKLVSDKEEIIPFVTGILTPGHTEGHMSFIVEVNNKKVCIAGDAITNLESIKK